MYSWMKKTVLATAISASLLTSSSVYASGIPTIDLAAIAKMAEQIVEMKKSYDMLKAQFEQAVEMTKKLEGISGVGDFIRSDIFKEIFPEVSEVIEAIDDFSYENMPQGAKDIFEDRGYHNACPPKGYPTYVQCRKDYALLATAQYMYQEAAINAQNRGQALDKLMDKISESKTMKEIADLQARIQGELGMIQLAQLQADQVDRAMRTAREDAIKAENQRAKDFFRTK